MRTSTEKRTITNTAHAAMVDRPVPMTIPCHESPYDIHDDHDRPPTKGSQGPFYTLPPRLKHESKTFHLVVPKLEPKKNDRD